jgi:hypothetical protein
MWRRAESNCRPQGYIQMIEPMILEFYELIVQHSSSWTKPAPKIVKDAE